jgi:MFS family permease
VPPPPPPFPNGQQGYGAGYGTPPPPYGQQPGWTPPPKPGLVPLRPLNFGTLIGAPFQVLRRNPKVTVGAALLIQGIPQAIVSLLIIGGLSLLFSRVDNASSADQGALQAGAVGWAIVLGLVSIIVSAVSTSLLQGIVVNEVARETLGEKLTLGSLWRLTRPRIGALIGWTVLVSVALAVVAGVLAGIAVLIFAGGRAMIGAGIAYSVIAVLGAIVVFVWLNTKLALVPSAIVLERLSIGSSMARSWRLTQGFFWKTLGVILLIGLIVYFVTQIITTPIALIGGFVTVLVNPTGLGASSSDPSVAQVFLSQLGLNAISAVVTAVIGAVMAVVQSSAIALIYLDLRMRKEGLDLHLVRFVEARQAGAAGLADPYEPPARPATNAAYPGS